MGWQFINGISIMGARSRSWTSYWAAQSEVLFFGEISKINAGRLYNQKSGVTDYLTVSGSAGSYTFQCPNTAPYIAADTDYIWFKTTGAQRTPTEAELIGYDFARTIVKYEDTSDYSIQAIMILSSGSSNENKMRNDFHLSVWWDDILSSYGYLKQNRPIVGQYVVSPDGTPSLLTATAYSNLQINLSCTIGSTNEDFVHWERSPNGTTGWAEIATTGNGVNTYSNTGLIPGTIYYYRCRVSKSGHYSTYSNIANATTTIVDADGNAYTEVTIGSQVWLTTNLRTTKYNDGTSMPTGLSNANWALEDGTAGHDGSFSDPNNNAGNRAAYGALYNWFAVSNAKGIAPLGYHIPTLTEINALATTLGGAGVAGGKMKNTGTTYWNSPNTGADDTAGFYMRGAGSRNTTGVIGDFKAYGSLWQSTTTGANGDSKYMAYNNDDLTNNPADKRYGFAVRCIKD